ncbi:MAG: hypothetical protein U1A27_13125 [Phycisphaerae bacterium]
MDWSGLVAATRDIGWRPPRFFGGELLSLLRHQPELLSRFLGVIVPMGVVNVLGSLQNVESAEAGGDRFSTGTCMAVNGLGTLAAGLCGSCFPTTIYIGHPGWKALGARAGYSVLNGLFFTVAFFFGLGALITHAIPMEAGMAIVLWIGVIITAQSYAATDVRHHPAVAIGMFPAVAAMGVFFVPELLSVLGATGGVLPLIQSHLTSLAQHRTDSWWPIGVYALAGANSSFVITTMVISAVSATLIDRRFRAAAVWCFLGTALTLVGFQHAFRIEPGRFSLSPRELMVWQRTEPAFRSSPLAAEFPGDTFIHRGYRIAAGYAAAGAMLLAIYAARRRRLGFADLAVDLHAAAPSPGQPPPGSEFDRADLAAARSAAAATRRRPADSAAPLPTIPLEPSADERRAGAAGPPGQA